MQDKRMTKSEFIGAIAEKVELPKKQVSVVLDAMNQVVAKELGQGGPGEVVVPGLLKLNVAVKPATPEREGINPFTRQPAIFKAKPERKIVKARVLKGLRDALGEAPAKKDDLALIEGIGPKIARAFRRAHITTFAQLAGTDVERLRNILSAAKLPGDPTTWPQQARLAADGKMDELQKLQDQLKGGRQV
jgi:predicted flap endonuclease-1-like 5' DNA nuclease